MEASPPPNNGDDDAPKTQTLTPSLFPIFPLPPNSNANPSTTTTAPQWLSNPSFTFDIKTLNPPSATPNPPSSYEEPPVAPTKSSAYDLVPSPQRSADSLSDEDERRLRKKERRRRKKKRKRDRRDDYDDDYGGVSRKSGVRVWAGEDARGSKDYYFDLNGDKDNLAFGSIYRMDVARYNIRKYPGSSAINFRISRRLTSDISPEEDQDVLDSKLKAAGRYFSVKFASLERNKDFKHVKIVDKVVPSVVSDDFIPLPELQFSTSNSNNDSVRPVEIEESWEDEMIRKTREFNRMSRECPHDGKVWLAFADLQDIVASKQTKKAARMQILEKKISILEKAVELNADHEELWLCLLKSYQVRDSNDVLMQKWENVLMQHPDSCKLWKEFLVLCQGEFSQFKVSEMRKFYGLALLALASACNKLQRQTGETTDFQPDSSLVQLELGLVDIFLGLCRFEWQAGYQELATGLFQAEIEYSLLSPSLYLSSQSKLRLFEHFWNSNAPRVGENGAIGWSSWLEKDEQRRQDAVTDVSLTETEVGGWTGWSQLPSKNNGTNNEQHVSVEPDLEGEREGEDSLDMDEIPLDDNIDELMKKLGINLDSEANSEVKDARTWKKWSEAELLRDLEQWMPVRESYGDPRDESDKEGNEQLSRVILFEDVSEYLFSLSSREAQISLVCQFIDFFGGKISQWVNSNKQSWIEQIHGLVAVSESLLEDLRVVFDLVNKAQNSSNLALNSFLCQTIDTPRSVDRMSFLRNAILLFLDILPRSHILEEALLNTEEKLMSQMKSSTCSANPSRALAKHLLKKDRQDILLCGVYARSEATYGNFDMARKIFDMALLSTDSLPAEVRRNVPLLYFWYAEMEVTKSDSSGNSDLSVQRATHILCCLGGNTEYTPFSCQPSAVQILRARQGFREQIKNLRSILSRGFIEEHSIALVCSASLFEFLTNCSSAAIQILEDAFLMVLPERRSQSLQLESLWIYYIKVLEKHLNELKFSKIWKTTEQGLQMYPYNPKVYKAMVQASYLYSVPSKLRIVFDECNKRNPSVVMLLFALTFELAKADSRHRIHSLFERALANDKLQKSVLLWRCYLAYETDVACNPSAARRVFFRAIHACPWSKRLWLDGFQKLSSILSVKELSDLQEVMHDKELNLKTDVYEILLQDEMDT